jgi:hypothetical protein
MEDILIHGLTEEIEYLRHTVEAQGNSQPAVTRVISLVERLTAVYEKEHEFDDYPLIQFPALRGSGATLL